MSENVDRLLEIMAKLRSPDDGCPWDVEQTFKTIAPYTIEEAYEVADAIERNDLEDLKGELGDLLFQVVFHARMAEEGDAFDFNDVVDAISQKMIKRHPHVFGDAIIGTADAQTINWEALKAEERRANNLHEIDVATALPALMRAGKIGKRAARMGFDWPESSGVLNKMQEELDEIRQAVAVGDTNNAAIEEEVGDFLFAAANLARHLGVEPEEALRSANFKFQRRFKAMELEIKKTGKSVRSSSLDELEAAWGQAKRQEKMEV